MLLLCAFAPAAAAAADPSLEVVGGTEVRKVSLQTCPATSSGTQPARACTRKSAQTYLGGVLTLLIRNTTEQVKGLEVRYLGDAAKEAKPLLGDSGRIFLLEGGSPSETVSENPATVGKEEARSLSVGFEINLSEAASSIDGTLVVSTAGEPPLTVPVAGEERSFAGVRVAPSTLPIDSSKGQTQLTIEGPELLEYLRSHGGEELRTTLYKGKHTTEATLTLPTAVEVEAEDGEELKDGTRSGYRAEPTVSLTDSHPAAGKYTGTLVLPGVPATGGSVTVELESHKSFWYLVLLVFAGVVVTGFGSRLVTTAARRKLLTTVLKQTYDVYRYVLCHGETRAWRLEDLLAENGSGHADPTKGGRLQGRAALLESIAEARSGADLDEDAGRVLDMIARMQRWLRVEPLGRRLLVASAISATNHMPAEPEAKKEGAPPGKPELHWAESKTVANTLALLEMVRREPADAEKADDLVGRLLFQIDWHSGIAAAWTAAGEDAPRCKLVRELDEALGDGSKAEERVPAVQDDLAARLRQLLSEPDPVTVPEIGQIEGEPIDETGKSLGITAVRWTASANLFTGWATLDAPSYGQLVRRAATSSRPRYMPGLAELKQAATPRVSDWLWTAVIVAVTCVVYGATVYSDTWGSWTDVATALAAGLLGKAAVDWAALPIFQSLRLRRTTA